MKSVHRQKIDLKANQSAVKRGLIEEGLSRSSPPIIILHETDHFSPTVHCTVLPLNLTLEKVRQHRPSFSLFL